VSDPRYARSFDSVAEQYERARPEYADEAVDWLVERLGLMPGSRVLDLAAGTGKLTRQLVRRGLDVVAVEPGDEMRGVLERVVPEVEALAGAAEAIPLPDASVDAVTVGQAFHWFDRDAAIAEMRRVLRPGGCAALLWNRWDEADPLLSEVDALLHEIRPPVVRRDDFTREHERRGFRQLRQVSVDALVEWAGSTSGWINASPEKQREIEAEIRRLGEGHAGAVSIATDVIVLTQLSDGSSGMRATSS
jgi:ubiquinone/menaquinone biosynthesis C-methylase UbiE